MKLKKTVRMEPPLVTARAPRPGGVDLQKMLILGLLNKKLPVPYAVVKPRQQKEIKPVEKRAPDKNSEGESEEECESPPAQVCGAKRKQSELGDDTERKEKR